MGITRSRVSILCAVLLLFVASCGSSDSTDDDMDMEGDHSEEEFHFGEPADAADATRTIEITSNDDFSFTPASVAITKGEIVTFKVTNAGAIPHDFTLGDEEIQNHHEEEMAAGGDMEGLHDDPNVFVVEPGETKEMTWHLTESGTILFGCHQPGHYSAGMKGTIVVTG